MDVGRGVSYSARGGLGSVDGRILYRQAHRSLARLSRLEDRSVRSMEIVGGDTAQGEPITVGDPESLAPLGTLGAVFKLAGAVVGNAQNTITQDGKTYVLVPVELILSLNSSLQDFVSAEKT